MSQRVEDALELALYLVGDDGLRDDPDGLCEALEDKYGVDMGGFEELANDLLRLTPVLISPLSQKPMHAFGRPDDGAFLALMRCESSAYFT